MDRRRALPRGRLCRNSGVLCRFCAVASNVVAAQARACYACATMHERAALFMQIPRRLGIVSAWLIGLALVFAAVNKNDPYLISLRGAGNAVIVVSSLLVVALLVRRGVWGGGWQG